MNEKIQKMITELALECRKEDVTLSLAAIDETGDGALTQVGINPRIELAIANQLEQLEKNMKSCGCLECKLRLAELYEEEPDEHDLENNVNEFTEKLAAFLRGDLT